MPSPKISPHVQIYKFPMTAISSILNRATGMALSGMFLGGSIIPYTYNEIQPIYQNLSKNTQIVLHSIIQFPVVYHTLGGFRHFIWDMYPNLLTNVKAIKSSYMLIGTSIITTGGIQYFFKSPLDIIFQN